MTKTLSKERALWVAALVTVCGASAALSARLRAPAEPDYEARLDLMHAHHASALPQGTQAKVACRNGAFVEASSIVGSTVEIMRTLPPQVPTRAREELDSTLYVALKQARAEVHCVAGTLTHGYERSFADTIRHGVETARIRGLGPDVIALGQTTVAILEANVPTTPPKSLGTSPPTSDGGSGDE